MPGGSLGFEQQWQVGMERGRGAREGSEEQFVYDGRVYFRGCKESKEGEGEGRGRSET